ncbi:MAG: glycosyltransferase family 4 protein [Deltaproteobacteria bacterium]|nr:glycosyltransferase family 4 protein [Deltaproteobacteria bacterium]
MRYSFNALLLVPRSTGMRTQMLGTLQGLRDLDGDDEWVVFLRPGLRDALPLPQWDRCKYVEIPEARTLPGRLWVELYGLPAYERRAGIDVSYSPTIYLPLAPPRPAAFTVVDFCWLRAPQGYSRAQLLSYHLRFQSSLLNTCAVATLTETVREELLTRFEVPRQLPCAATLSGVDPSFFRPPPPETAQALRQRLGLPASDRLLLGSGGTNPRKNVTTLVRAFARLPRALRRQTHLVIPGPREPRAEQRLLAPLSDEVRSRIHFTGFLPANEAVALHGLADLFAFPTLDEGLGLPALEAQAAGLPTILSDIPVLREVGGPSAVYAPPTEVDAWTAAIASAFDDDAQLARRADNGRRWASAFTWKSVADRIVSLLRQVSTARG